MLPKYEGNTMSSRVSVVGVGLRRSSSRKVRNIFFFFFFRISDFGQNGGSEIVK